MQIPIINGIYTDEASDFRTSYPKNLIPVPKEQGISKGYLRPADGIVSFGTGPGIDRGGINWDGVYYRVMGTKLVSIDNTGTATTIGDVGGSTQVAIDYSFDYMAIASNNQLWLYDGTTLTQNTDPDLGTVLDVIFVDGYFMTTDGEYLVITELGNPFAVDPFKYGSSEVDPDPIKGLLKLRNEPVALNRYTIEFFDNVGSSGFPFQRIEGAQIQRGVVGTHCACVFLDNIAFLGSGRSESPAVWLASSGQSIKISTREIDQIIQGYAEDQLELVVVEAKVDKGHQHLFIHFPDQTLVYDGAASQAMQVPVWFSLSTSLTGTAQYKARNFVWCYDKWLVGDPTEARHGYFTNELSSHYGEVNGWEFGTTIIYNNGMGALFHELELVCLTGRAALGDDPTIITQYSLDGEAWSMEKMRTAGKIGERNKRIVWLNQGNMRNWRMQRFKGTSDAHLSMARLEARLEPLEV